MKAVFGLDVPVDAWKVTHDEAPEPWVQELLDQKKLVFKKDAEGIFIRPAADVKNAGLVSQIVLSKTGGTAFENAQKAYVGDYLIRTMDGEFRAVSEKKFAKEYKIS